MTESPRNPRDLLGTSIDVYDEIFRRTVLAGHQLGRRDLFPAPLNIDWWWDAVLAATLKE